MMTFKGLCDERIKDVDEAVDDAVKKYVGQTLAPTQIKRLETIRDDLENQEQ